MKPNTRILWKIYIAGLRRGFNWWIYREMYAVTTGFPTALRLPFAPPISPQAHKRSVAETFLRCMCQHGTKQCAYGQIRGQTLKTLWKRFVSVLRLAAGTRRADIHIDLFFFFSFLGTLVVTMVGVEEAVVEPDPERPCRAQFFEHPGTQQNYGFVP